MRRSRNVRRNARRSFKSSYHRGGVRRKMRGFRKRHNRRGKPQYALVSRGGLRL